MQILSKIMLQMGLVERRTDGRVPGPNLEVLYGAGERQQAAEIRDISATGMFLLLREPLQPGTNTVLTLRSKASSNRHCGTAVRLWARAVRQDGQGAGLTFVREGAAPGQWIHLMETAAKLDDSDAISRFRIARALAFLARIAAPVQEEIADLMTNAMDNERRERLIAMVLEVEERLERENRIVRSGISPRLVREILLFGSAAEDKVTQSFWSRLLSTSCLPVYRDAESLHLAEILSNLLPVHLDIFNAACELTISGGKWSQSGELLCTLEEIRDIAHTPNLNVIDQYLTHLCELGLLGRTMKPRKGEQIRHANLTVTQLGVELYARCWAPPHAEEGGRQTSETACNSEGVSIPQ